MPPSRKYSDPDAIAQISDLTLPLDAWSRVRSAASTAARFMGSTSSLRSTANTTSGMTSADSIGASSVAPTVTTSSSTNKKATYASPSSSTPARP